MSRCALRVSLRDRMLYYKDFAIFCPAGDFCPREFLTGGKPAYVRDVISSYYKRRSSQLAQTHERLTL